MRTSWTADEWKALELEFRNRAAGPAEERLRAIVFLCQKLSIDRSEAELTYDPSIKNAYAVALSARDVRFGPLCFEPYTEFALVVRVIAHELLHVEQKTKRFPITDHDERELLAYCDTIFRTDFPPIRSKETLKYFTDKAIAYYTRLVWWKRIRYKNLHQQLIVFRGKLVGGV